MRATHLVDWTWAAAAQRERPGLGPRVQALSTARAAPQGLHAMRTGDGVRDAGIRHAWYVRDGMDAVHGCMLPVRRGRGGGGGGRGHNLAGGPDQGGLAGGPVLGVRAAVSSYNVERVSFIMLNHVHDDERLSFPFRD